MPDRLAAALADRYRLERELGAGGMATVYLAHDLKHERDVAIKVLHPDLGAALGAERFLSEIKTTARLQHPHILPLLDSGAADGFLYYVMPVVTGETLRARLNRERQLPMAEAVRIAKEVASALDYAHRQGVVHRDIKPENILLHDGQALVADFGIALAVQSAGGARMTQTGLSLGTPQYMSPEQALGERTIDARSDIYALGAVTYEMITGDPPFSGANVQAIVARLLNEKPTALHTLRDTVPVAVEEAVLTALAKLPADRFESAKAFGDALVTTGGITVQRAAAVPISRPVAFASRYGGWILFAMAMTVALIEGVAMYAAKQREPVVRTARFDLEPGDVPLRAGSEFVISPNGEMLAYTAGVGGQAPFIYVREVYGSGQWRRLAVTALAGTPSFSPDGRQIVFRRGDNGLIYRVSVDDGGAVLVPTPRPSFFPQWVTDDLIAVAAPGGSNLLSASGAPPRPIPSALGGRLRSMLPDQSGMLGQVGESVALWDFETDSVQVLIPQGRHAVYAASGHIVYAGPSSGLYAVAFDLKTRRVIGAPVRVLPQVASTIDTRGFSISQNGTLVYLDGPSTDGDAGNLGVLVVIHPGGRRDTLQLPPSRQFLPRISPDGRRIAYTQQARGNGSSYDLMVHDLARGTATQLTFAGEASRPIWSPDGARLAFGLDSTTTNGTVPRRVLVIPADGSGPGTPIGAPSSIPLPTDWPAADQLLVDAMVEGQQRSDIFRVSPTQSGAPVAYSPSAESELGAVVAPDGRHAAFVREGSATSSGVWVREYPNAVGQWKIATGNYPRWSRDGKYVYYWRTGPLDSLFRVPVERGTSVVAFAEELVVAIDAYGIANWDLFADGRVLLTVIAPTEVTSPSGNSGARPKQRIVTNWFAELTRLMSAAPPR